MAVRALVLGTAIVALSVAYGIEATAQAIPQPLASPAPATRGSFDRHELTLAPGSTAVVHMFGASSMTLATSGSGADVRFDGPSRSVTITALTVGETKIVGTDPGGNSDTITVHVVPPAGVIPSDISVNVAGTPTVEFLTARAHAELRPQLKLCAGCTFDFPGAPLDPAQATQRLDVRLRGPIAATVTGSTTLHLTSVPFVAAREPAMLLYSDDPESVGSDGVLLRSTQPIDTQHPARLYAYHAAADAGRSVYAIVTTLGTQSDVQLTGTAIGPYGDYHCVGHAATMTYLTRRAQHEGLRAHVTPDAPLVLRLNARAMPARTLVTGIYDVVVAAGDPVRVSVVSASGDASPVALLGGRLEPGDGHGRRGEYELSSVKTPQLAYTVGSHDVSIPAGGGGIDGELLQLSADYPALHGEFGVLRSIALHLQNPTATAQTVNLYIAPVNGPDTLTMWFAGDTAPLEVGRVADPNVRTLVRQFVLAPNATLDTSALFMPDGSSWFPVELGVTASPVAPPPPNPFDTCARALTDQAS